MRRAPYILKITPPLLLALLLTVLTASESAQTVYQPVQYQYGLHGEIFYGGQNPAFASNPYLFLPEVLRNQPLLMRTGINPTVPYSPAIYPLTQHFGLGTPLNHPTYFNSRVPFSPPQLIFSDIAPFQELSQFGFTIDDARNEAYLNVPRYHVGAAKARELQDAQRAAEPREDENAPAPEAAPANDPAKTLTDRFDPAKAKPLLDWAKDEHAKGHTALAQELIRQAARFDAPAAEKLRTSLQTAKP